MTGRRMFGMAIGALGPVALLALLFGNQWAVDSVADHNDNFRRSLRVLVSWLQFPTWRFTGGRFRSSEVSLVLSIDFSTLLFLGLTGALVLGAARSLDPRRGHLGAVVLGWWASVVAGGLAGFVRGTLLSSVYEFPGELASQNIWNTVSQGAGFGLVYGWFAGLGALVAFLITRPREYAPQQPMPGVPFGAQPPQQSGAHQLPSHHPAAVPYVPPAQAQPPQPQPQQLQQPAWGSAPVPQQAPPPGPPPAPAAPAAPAPAPAASAPVPAPDVPTPAAPAPDEGQSDAVAVVEPAKPADPEPEASKPEEPKAEELKAEEAKAEEAEDDTPESDASPKATAPTDVTMVDGGPAADDRPLPPPV